MPPLNSLGPLPPQTPPRRTTGVPRRRCGMVEPGGECPTRGTRLPKGAAGVRSGPAPTVFGRKLASGQSSTDRASPPRPEDRGGLETPAEASAGAATVGRPGGNNRPRETYPPESNLGKQRLWLDIDCGSGGCWSSEIGTWGHPGQERPPKRANPSGRTRAGRRAGRASEERPSNWTARCDTLAQSADRAQRPHRRLPVHGSDGFVKPGRGE